MPASELIEDLAADCLHIIIVHAPKGHIQRMGSDVDQRAATLEGFIRKYTPGRNRPSSYGMSFCIVDFSEVTGFTGCVQVHDFRPETVLVPDGKLHAGFLPGRHHFLSFFRAVAHRFFDIHMLFCFKCGHRHFAVEYIWRTDMDNLHLRVGKQLMIVRIKLSPRCSVFFACLFCALFAGIAESYNFAQITVALHGWQMLLQCYTAASDYADSQFSH